MRVISFVAAVLWAGLTTVPAQSENPDAGGRAQVMVLGTFHFASSGSDVVNVDMGDMLAPERQAQISDVLDRLERFAPTKIAIELLPERQAVFNETYQAYLRGAHDLSANERQQLGMRLAKRLGHDGLYAVDYAQGMDFERMMAAGEAAGQTELLARLNALMTTYEDTFEREQGPGRTVLQALRYHNGPGLKEGNLPYMLLAMLGPPDNPAGAEVVGDWYTRNLAIYANIMSLIESPEDRILVIYGSGHAPQLTDFLEQNPDVALIPALDVLGDEESFGP